MKLFTTLVSLLSTALILPLVLSTPTSGTVDEVAVDKIEARAPEVVAEEYVPTTNAERFARGLPPLSPSKSRNRGSPTRRDTVSPLPPVTYRGIIEVYYDDGSLAGYIAAQGQETEYYDFTTSVDDQLIVSFSLPAGQISGTTLNLLTENSQKYQADVAPYFGYGGHYQDFDLPNGYSYAWPIATAYNPGQAAAGANSNAQPYIESGVWAINVVTGAMSIDWQNSDGTISTPPVWNYANIPILDNEDRPDLGQLTFKFVLI